MYTGHTTLIDCSAAGAAAGAVFNAPIAENVASSSGTTAALSTPARCAAAARTALAQQAAAAHAALAQCKSCKSKRVLEVRHCQVAD